MLEQLETPIAGEAPSVSMDDHLKLLREHAELKLMYDRLKESKRNMRQTFRYYGSKWVLAEWIISHFSPHYLYLEPFFGTGGVFFSKPPSSVEVISDLNGDIVRFFKVLREHPDDLIRAIVLTPYAEGEYQSAYEMDESDDIECARRFYVQLKMSWNSGGERGSFRRNNSVYRKPTATTEFSIIDHLYSIANRLKCAQIDQSDAISQIKRYDNPKALMYVDPPYVQSTRSETRYALDMTDAGHEALAECLQSVKGMVVLSGYDSPLYQKLFPGWKMERISARTIDTSIRTECLWLNPAASRQSQKRLF